MKSYRPSRVMLVVLIGALGSGLFLPPAQAWKPTTHLYTANVIADDAKDGKVTIPPYGEFEIADSAQQMLTQPDYYRGGSIGPDAFPDLWTGQSYIHPKTRAWALYLWDRANSYNDAKVWAFTYGFYLHIAGDAWCHDWVNDYAGGSFPYAKEFQENPEKATLNVMRHMAIENTFDKAREKTEKLQACSIALPRDFVLKEMVLYPKLRTEMNPMVQALTKLYDEKKPYEKDRVLGVRTYNARWFTDLDVGLRKYVEANERAWKGVIEKDENTVAALEDNLGGWAEDNLLSMLGAPDIVADAANAPGKVLAALADGVTALLKMAGIDIDVLAKLKDQFVNAMLKSTMGITKDQFREMLLAEVNTDLFPGKQEIIMSDIGTIPAQAMWPHGPETAETDATKAETYINTVKVNGPLYNTIILGKITLLKPEEFKRLAEASQAAPRSNLPANVMLENWLEGIDFSRQCQWAPGERKGEVYFMGYANPHESPVFRNIFKPYPPIFQPAQVNRGPSRDALP
jgi:hypothetical protein